ncbi:MAG: MGMT family protein [Candidatus Altiarchaeota archaeon]|nr:MGMT family protein [Candidatus Altiarchaeota archaeon]
MAYERLAWEVLRLAREIPRGRVSTYGALAEALGNKNLARFVGRALGMNENPAKTPCHRVVRADGRLGGYRWGIRKKAALLRTEGVDVRGMKVEDMNRRLFGKFRRL